MKTSRTVPLTTLAATLVLVLFASACGSASSTSDPPATAPTATSTTTASTAAVASDDVATSCTEVAAAFSTNGSKNADLPDPEARASCVDDTVVVTSNGIPDYTYIETSPGSPRANALKYQFPATPKVADSVTAIPRLGSLGIATNGIPIFGPTEGQGGDVLATAGLLSECGSHNGPTGFHMHLAGTSDTTDCIFTPKEVAAAPQLLGYAFDGYPIYTGNDQYTSSWKLTDESLFATDTWAAHTYVKGSGDLDECNGLTDANGRYAYYTTDAFPYVMGCYTGVVDVDDAIVSGF